MDFVSTLIITVVISLGIITISVTVTAAVGVIVKDFIKSW